VNTHTHTHIQTYIYIRILYVRRKQGTRWLHARIIIIIIYYSIVVLCIYIYEVYLLYAYNVCPYTICVYENIITHMHIYTYYIPVQCTRRAANTPRSHHLWRCATPASQRTSQKLVITLPAPLVRGLISFTYIFLFLIFLLLLFLLVNLCFSPMFVFSARYLDDAKPSARRDNNIIMMILLFSSPYRRRPTRLQCSIF